VLSKRVCYSCRGMSTATWEARWQAKGFIWCKRLGLLTRKAGRPPEGCPYVLEHLMEMQREEKELEHERKHSSVDSKR